ncbi:ferredoxin [Nocardioides sp. Leaf374]|uniref:ferredoxin n=1 Tax=Nocardioides sp. Leaf374 TaxID=2876560 RepID=UPI001E494979|nr:ferredoxin [Nocardioides sp. Leaf374]
MKITVDYDRCEGIGMCESLAPHHFQLEDNGNLTVLQAEVAPEDVSDVEEAVASCPTGALRLQ